MRGLRRAARFAGLHPPTQKFFALNGPFIQSFIKIGRQVTEKSVPYRQTTDKRSLLLGLNVKEMLYE